MQLRDIVKAQIRHEETDFVPYMIEFEDIPKQRLNEHFGSEKWMDNIVTALHMTKSCFDSWDTMYVLDPAKPEVQMDVYGNRWTKTDKIAHLDHPALEDVDPRDYQWPDLSGFLTPGKWEALQQSCLTEPNKFIIAPAGAGHFELSWRLMGVENALISCIAEPDEYDYIIDHLDHLLNQFIDECVKLPVDAVMLFDDWCDQRHCTMGPERWRKYIKPRLAGLYQKIHKSGKIVINHVCGSVAPLIPDLIEIGLDVLESVQPEAANMNPYELKKKYGDKLTFCGGLGCQSTVTFATPDELRGEIRHLRSEMSRGGGYILQPAKTINETVPMENLLAIVETFTEENGKLG